MATIDHACRRIGAVIDEIERLRESDFPYPHAREALGELERMFRGQLNVLKRIPSGAAVHVVNNACSTSLHQLFIYVPILGFLLRSTNVRNAFEAYWPLLRLARRLLGDEIKLVLSSEWDYSPFAYVSIAELPGFVLIGSPAPESTNPLLIPLAGHEFGHWLWQVERLTTRFEKQIETAIVQELSTNRWKDYSLLYPQHQLSDLRAGTLFTRLSWRPAFTWAMRQVEESFCDFIGIRLFAEAYLHAFSYLLSPRTQGQRPLNYPNITRRVNQIAAAAAQMKVVVPPDFLLSFEEEEEPPAPHAQLLVGTADVASAALVPSLVETAQQICDEKSAPMRNEANVRKMVADFEKVIPSARDAGLCDVLNAGWKCQLDTNLWKSVLQILPENRDRVLRDLVLKSTEILEVTERTRSVR